MKISYGLRWCPETGTAYRQAIRITKEENQRLFGGSFKLGVNYGNAYTGGYVAARIYGLPGYEKHLKRIIVANSIVYVGNGVIPVYGEEV